MPQDQAVWPVRPTNHDLRSRDVEPASETSSESFEKVCAQDLANYCYVNLFTKFDIFPLNKYVFVTYKKKVLR